jgi:tetratricopeptide (TPR) repeat protein/flagellar motor protein MotB
MNKTIFFLVLLLHNVLPAQVLVTMGLSTLDTKEQQLVNENSRLMQEELLLEADLLADELLKLNPESSNYNYRKGFAVLYAFQRYDIAKSHFEKAIKNTKTNYDAFSKNELSAPHDAIYHLAVCEHNLGNYDQAEDLFTKFKVISRKESALLATIDLKFVQLKNARNQISNSSNNPIRQDAINTEFDDYCPIISADGSKLQFTSRRNTIEHSDFGVKHLDNTFLVQLNKDGISPIEPVLFGHKDKNESLVFSSINERFLIYYSESEGNGDLFQENVIRNSQTIPKINTEFWETHAYLTHDGQTFYFVSDKLQGYGGRDIYKCELIGSGWSEPINLGPTINSKHDEDAPFVSIDGKTLYFSSNGEKSSGGFDIFYSQFSNKEWSEPHNLGAPYNSASDDVFYVTTSDGKSAYFSSNRADSKGKLDIYSIPALSIPNSQIAVFKGIIKTKDGKELPEDVALSMSITCLDCSDNNSAAIALHPNMTNGVILHCIDPCKSYKVNFKNEDEPFDELDFSTLCDLEYQEVSREFIYDIDSRKFITPEIEVIKPDFASIRFNTFLDYNKTKVSETDNELITAFKEIEKQLQEGKESISISIYSSASKVPTKKFGNNQRLADKRAKDLKELLERIINNNELLSGKVTINLVKSSVNGPDYEKDARNQEKYKPFQYLIFETN